MELVPTTTDTMDFTVAASILHSVKTGDVALVRGSWLLERAGYRQTTVTIKDGRHEPRVHKWVRHEACSVRSLPMRQELEAQSPDAYIPVEELEDYLEQFRSISAAAHADPNYAIGVISVSHCWERQENPDPESRTLATIGEALAGEWHGARPESGLPLFQVWGFKDVGVFFDWTSLYQKGPSGTRTPPSSCSCNCNRRPWPCRPRQR